MAVELWQAKVRHYPALDRASEKLVTLFEPHVDIVRKGSEVAYGHGLNLTTGRSG